MARGRPRDAKPGSDGTAGAQGATAGHEAEPWALADTLRDIPERGPGDAGIVDAPVLHRTSR